MIESSDSGTMWSAVLQGLLRVEPLMQLLSNIPPHSDVQRLLVRQLSHLSRMLLLPGTELDLRPFLGPMEAFPKSETTPGAAVRWVLETMHKELQWGDYKKPANAEAVWAQASESPISRIFGFVMWHA